jgi:putative endonuclease
MFHWGRGVWQRFTAKRALKGVFAPRASETRGSDPQELGRQGEQEAYRFLRRQGYQVVARNFRSRRGEVDLIGWDRDILCFVEVKTRIDTGHGRPEEAVTQFKQGQILNASLDYLHQANLHGVNTRYDIVAVEVGRHKAPVCRLIKQAWRCH